MRQAMAILFFAFLASFAFTAWANEKSDEPAGEKNKDSHSVAVPLKEMLEPLDLTDEQKTKINAITTAFSKKVKKTAAEIDAIFTEQQRKLRDDAIKAAVVAGKTDRAEIAKAVSDAVKLSDEQKEKMQSLNRSLLVAQREMVAKIKDLLTPEQSERLRNLVEKRAAAKAKTE
jgi:Spy/CpxP family protein refolding chaperone